LRFCATSGDYSEKIIVHKRAENSGGAMTFWSVATYQEITSMLCDQDDVGYDKIAFTLELCRDRKEYGSQTPYLCTQT
jgi:hypothetical protein